MNKRNIGPEKHGFTLLELLASIALLSIIVVSMSKIFAESDRAWTLGTARATCSADGRAALNILEHDLQYAAAGCYTNPYETNISCNLTFSLVNSATSPELFGLKNSELRFISLKNKSTNTHPRAAMQIVYWVRTNAWQTYDLVKSETYAYDESGANVWRCYDNPTWYNAAGVKGNDGLIAENVTAFYCEATVFTSPTTTASGLTTTNTYESLAPRISGIDATNTLPHYVDVMLEMLSESDARQLQKTGGDKRAFIEKRARRFTTRIYFNNRTGYLAR
jgi:prepilin-type N-terminal cleavage/methylation domain-containing protein